MPELVICRGLPASGKTTVARLWVADDPTGRARVNRDDLRGMAHDSVWHRDNETRIVAVRDASIEALLRAGVSVISDDTNLPQRTARELARIGRRCGAEVRVWDMSDVPLELCVARDAIRTQSVGAEVIEGMHRRFLAGAKYPLPLPDDPEPEKVEQYRPDTSLPGAWIVDLDGTLALKSDRSPYAWDRVGEDTCNEPVRDLVWALERCHRIVILSGRDSVCRQKTETWLAEHRIDFSALFMRPQGDMRKDSVVKLEMFREWVAPRYYVRGVIDDRDQVVEMWRSIGLTCAQVAPGDF